MSLSLKDDPTAEPIAYFNCDKGKEIIYLYKDDKTFKEVPSVNVHTSEYICPYCQNKQSSKQQLEYHINKSCKEKGKKMRFLPGIKTESNIGVIPTQSHEIYFITGPPGCGKSYFCKEYMKTYKKLYDGNIYLFTTHEKDETLNDIEDKIIRIEITDEMLEDKFELSDFKNSLVVFDDVETSKYPNATKYVFNLIDDIAKNGRHHNINMIFVNQECRLGKKTKNILTMLTKLVIFPKTGETYQIGHLLKEYCGMSANRIRGLLGIDTRWLLISRSVPQYVVHEHGIFILGKEAYVK